MKYFILKFWELFFFFFLGMRKTNNKGCFYTTKKSKFFGSAIDEIRKSGEKKIVNVLGGFCRLCLTLFWCV